MINAGGAVCIMSDSPQSTQRAKALRVTNVHLTSCCLQGFSQAVRNYLLVWLLTNVILWHSCGMFLIDICQLGGKLHP